MKTVLKSILKGELRFIIALIILFLVLITIPNILFFIMQNGDDPLDINNILKHDDVIMGIGTYKLSGEAITIIGNAPDKLSGDLLQSQLIINKHAKTALLIKPIKESNNSPINRGYIYLELYIREALIKYNLIKLTIITIPIVFIFIFIIMYKRHLNYRKKMASQEQLIRLGEVARTLSHEIKNPLGAISIQTSYLKRVLQKENYDKHKIGKLTIIEQEVQRLALLTNRIGDFLRDPVGSQQAIELTSFINEMIKRFDWEIHFNNKTEGSVNIMADTDRLRSVIENIIRNAIESMDNSVDNSSDNISQNSMNNNSERHPVEINLNSDGKGKRIELSILDQGCGIPSELNDHVFDPFFTSKTKGSGIGLFVSQRFIEAMGGSLSLHARKDGVLGTEARIVFKRIT